MNKHNQQIPYERAYQDKVPKYSIGTAVKGAQDTDPDGFFNSENGLSSTILGAGDYVPNRLIRFIEVHGAQSGKAVAVEFLNGTQKVYDNITVLADPADNGIGWIKIEGALMTKILKTGTTASGIYPYF